MTENERIGEICRQMLIVHYALEALAKRDPEAPDRGSNHAQYETLQEGYDALEEALVRTALPTTTAGIQALAQLAMTFAPRTFEGALDEVYCFADWLRLAALSSAAGKPETIPLWHQEEE